MLLPTSRSVASRPARQAHSKFSAGFIKSMWNDIPADELKQLMDEIDPAR
jgi:hypothetical protein